MVPKVSRMKPRQLGGDNHPNTTVEPNVDTACFSLRQVNDDGSEDLIHFCNWPAMRDTIDQFMAERATEA